MSEGEDLDDQGLLNNREFDLSKVTSNTALISTPPLQVGGYRIGGDGKSNAGITFMITSKPKYIHRLFCKLLLGWEWVE